MTAEQDSIETILLQDDINLEKLKELTFNGCPDNGSTRARCWRLILGKWFKILERIKKILSKFL